ncbi:MAG TPA: XRE family transcriptional regulator [Methylococcaceae bacterium]|nr:XRE family transcriptional regulator [Methylococcaceae bacterium]
MESIDNSPVWANNAKAKMTSMNLKYKDILHLFDVTTTDAIGHYFNGRREPNISNLLSLADFLNISTDELFLDNTKLQERKTFKGGANLMDALKILLKLSDISDQDLVCTLNTIDKVGTDNIMEAANALAEDEDNCLSRTDTILNIQDYMAKVV